MILNNGRNFLKALKIGIVPQELEAKSPWKMGTVLEELNAKKVCGKWAKSFKSWRQKVP